MMLTIPDLLSADQLRHCRQTLLQAEWTDGRATAGHQAARAKQNLQLPLNSPVAEQIGGLILEALGRNPVFVSAALPLKVLPPRFNRYEGGGHYADHIDSAILSIGNSGHRLRSDLSATLFLSEPADYDGGELMVEDSYGRHSFKLPAGQLLLYPSSSLHRVTPVTRGTRLAAFFWVQSLVREDSQRRLLWELDRAIQSLTPALPAHPALPQLTGVYHNLLRRWSST